MHSYNNQLLFLLAWLSQAVADSCGSHAHRQALDADHGVNVSWTVHADRAELDVCVSAPMQPGGWLGTGWNTRTAGSIRTPGFLMEGADLVLGYPGRKRGSKIEGLK